MGQSKSLQIKTQTMPIFLMNEIVKKLFSIMRDLSLLMGRGLLKLLDKQKYISVLEMMVSHMRLHVCWCLLEQTAVNNISNVMRLVEL